MSSREVTERDLRMPEFRDAKPEELEFRGDGKLVRKDRWETGFRSIAYMFNLPDWEVPDVVTHVRMLAAQQAAICQAAADDIWAHVQEGRL